MSTEWQDAKKGFRYIFNNDGRYSKTNFNKEIKQRGDYQIKENELSLYFKKDDKEDTLGYRTDFNEERKELTLSPSYLSICIEGYFYRFKKQ